MLVMASIELLYWDGCPSYPEALEELRGVLRDLGRGDVAVALRHVSTDEQARTLGFVGSPTIHVDGADPLPPDPGEPVGLTCRVYRLRDGRYSPVPDRDDL